MASLLHLHRLRSEALTTWAHANVSSTLYIYYFKTRHEHLIIFPQYDLLWIFNSFSRQIFIHFKLRSKCRKLSRNINYFIMYLFCERNHGNDCRDCVLIIIKQVFRTTCVLWRVKFKIVKHCIIFIFKTLLVFTLESLQ